MIRSAAWSIAVTAAFCVAVVAVVLVLVPVALAYPEPSAIIGTFVTGPFRSPRYVGNIVELATPAMLCGLAVTIMFRAGALNLGGDGAFFLGGLGATATSLLVPLPGWAAPEVGILAGALVGSTVCIAPGLIKITTGASELVTSLMLNYAAVFLGLFVLNHYLRDTNAGAMVSLRLPAAVRLTRLVPETRINIGSVVAITACLAGSVVLFRTRNGFEARLVGVGNRFAAHLGLNASSIAMRAQVIGGLIAAAGGALEVFGLYPRFSWQSSPGFGWTGVIVAILARNNPLAIVPAALFLSYLEVGGDLLARNAAIPSEIVALIQALVMLLATSMVLVEHPAVRRLVGRGRAAVVPA